MENLREEPRELVPPLGARKSSDLECGKTLTRAGLDQAKYLKELEEADNV